MKELVFSNNGQVVTNSLLVAEKFGKNHRDVLEAIDELAKGLYNTKRGYAENSATLFSESSYVHPQNKQTYRMYIMNRDGFSLLVMGFTGQKALEFKIDFIEAFNAYERKAQATAHITICVNSNIFINLFHKKPLNWGFLLKNHYLCKHKIAFQKNTKFLLNH